MRAREEKTLAKLFAWEALLKLAEADTHAKEANIARLTCHSYVLPGVLNVTGVDGAPLGSGLVSDGDPRRFG